MKYKVEKSNYGDEYWCKYGTNILHREAGAALINSKGSKGWWQDKKRHREVGAAIIDSDGREENYINGKKIK